MTILLGLIFIVISFSLYFIPEVLLSEEWRTAREIKRNLKENKKEEKAEQERQKKQWLEYERNMRAKEESDKKEKEKQSRFNMYKMLRQKIEQMPIYKRWRNEVLERCNNKCQMCGISNNLEVHHRNSFYSIFKRNNISNIEQAFECKELWDTSNGEVLCVECHKKMESSKKMKELNQ